MMSLQSKFDPAVTGQQAAQVLRSAGLDAERILSVINGAGLACVPRIPSQQMLDSDLVYEAAHEEDAVGVWKYMIRAFEDGY